METRQAPKVEDIVSFLQEKYEENDKVVIMQADPLCTMSMYEGDVAFPYTFEVKGDPKQWFVERVATGMSINPEKTYVLWVRKIVYKDKVLYTSLLQLLTERKKRESKRKRKQPEPAAAKRKSRKPAAARCPYDHFFEG
jgi:hypothetical protein